MKFVGAHVSAAGGVDQASFGRTKSGLPHLPCLLKISANGVQLRFLKM